MKTRSVSGKRPQLTGRCRKRTVCEIIANRCGELGDLEMLLSAPLIQANSAGSPRNQVVTGIVLRVSEPAVSFSLTGNARGHCG